MQIIYATKKNNRLYEVVKTNRGLVLRINGTNTTQSIGGAGKTNAYYDEIAQAIPLQKDIFILMLGLAGGTVARRYRELGGKGYFYGIDNDAEMIKIGEIFFGLKKWVNDYSLLDARKFVEKEKSAVWNIVIDDLYVNGEERVLVNAKRLVKPGGIYIQNIYPLGVDIQKL